MTTAMRRIGTKAMLQAIWIGSRRQKVLITRNYDDRSCKGTVTAEINGKGRVGSITNVHLVHAETCAQM
jgi:hypothetical protein